MRRPHTLLLIALAATSLAACKPVTPPAEITSAPGPVAGSEPAAAQAVPSPVADAGTDAAPAADPQASFTGFGDMKLGSTVEEARAAWAGELNGGPMEGTTCHYLSPKWVKVPSELAFMMEEGRFVRYDVGTAQQTAPGGGKVGMTVEALQKLYDNALESTPHKYVQGGSNLSIAASGVAPGKLVFETDAAGKVISWHLGLVPQVDYVEGCS